MTFIIIAAAALIGGVYVGLGAPGFPGRQDRIVTSGRARRLKPNYIHWLRPKR